MYLIHFNFIYWNISFNLSKQYTCSKPNKSIYPFASLYILGSFSKF